MNEPKHYGVSTVDIAQAEIESHHGHRIVKDAFAELTGVVRAVPGNAYCLDCGKPIPWLVDEKEPDRG